MKKILAFLLFISVFSENSFAQKTPRPTSIGFSIIGSDYTTAEQIRTTSLSEVLRNKRIAAFKDMGHGLSVHYIKGLTSNIDLNASLAGSFVKFALPGKTVSQNDFLLEIDASANFKMFSDGTTVNPYLIAGIGASKYTNVLGAIIPLGVGFEVNIFNEARFFSQLQYRVPVTTEANKHHFQVSFGIASFL